MAEPIEIPIQVSGSIASYPNGTIYIEPVTTAAGIYNGGIKVVYFVDNGVLDYELVEV